MEYGPSWEPKSRLASQGIPCFLWKPKIHLQVHKPATSSKRWKCLSRYGAEFFLRNYRCSASQGIPRGGRGGGEGSIPWSQEFATWPCTETDKNTPSCPTVSFISVLILPPHLRLSFLNGFFSSCFPTWALYAFFSVVFMRNTLPMSSSLIWST